MPAPTDAPHACTAPPPCFLAPPGSPHRDPSTARTPPLPSRCVQCPVGTTFNCTAADLCSPFGSETVAWWATPFTNFDHFGRALLTLFVIATLDGYMGIAYTLVDAVAVDKQVRAACRAPGPKGTNQGRHQLCFDANGTCHFIQLHVMPKPVGAPLCLASTHP